MWTWPFKISPVGIGTIFAGVVVLGSSMAAWLVDDKVEACNAQWSSKVAQANLALKTATMDAERKINELTEKLAEAEKNLEIKAVKDEQILEKQREADKLSADCSKCRVPNSWIWVRPEPAAGSNPASRPTTESRRMAPQKAP